MLKSFTLWASIFSSVFLISFTACQRIPDEIRLKFPARMTVVVKNPLNAPRQDAVVFLDISKLKEKMPDFNPTACLVWADGQELPSQMLDRDANAGADQIVLTAQFGQQEAKKLVLCYNPTGEAIRNYPKRTLAELSHKMGGKFVGKKYIGGTFRNVTDLHVPPEHTDHDEFIRYEGPGWESDRIGYRFYLDWRNAIDLFGKKKPVLVLQDVGQDGYDSYHNMADWGMDILNVGASLGIGSIGMWYGDKAERVAVTDSSSCHIVSNGPVYSEIRTNYYGWKVGSAVYDLTSDLSITAGSRMTMHSLEIHGNPENLCTGLVKDKNANLIKSVGDKWAYLALWGKQSLAKDNLGMAVYYRTADLLQITEDVNSHVLVLKPHEGCLTYAFLAAWEQEIDGIRSEQEFTSYLEKVLRELDKPLIVTY